MSVETTLVILEESCIHRSQIFLHIDHSFGIWNRLLGHGQKNVSHHRNSKPIYSSFQEADVISLENQLAPMLTKFSDDSISNCRGKQQDLINAMGSMYASVLFLGVANSASVQPVVSVERTVFYREKAAGMYSALPYAFGQVSTLKPASPILSCCMLLLIIHIIFYSINRLQLSFPTSSSKHPYMEF